MKISDLVRIGLKNLSRRKARTALTIVGVIIGTISIVVMISIGIGMNTSFRKMVMEQGSLTLITITKFQEMVGENDEYLGSKQQNLDDKLIGKLKQIEHVESVTPVIQSKFIEMKVGQQYEANIYLTVMDSTVFKKFGFPELAYGEYPTEENRDIIVMGAEVPNVMFSKRNSFRYEPISIDFQKEKRIKISLMDYSYQIKEGKKAKEIPWDNTNIAVMQPSSNHDYNCYMDITTFKKHYREFIQLLKPEDKRRAERALKNYDAIQINTDNIKNVEKVQDVIKNMNLQPQSLGDALKPYESTSNMMQMVLGGVGAVSMLVSAISIANTMVMSIYERTKEIGVMKVLGCLIRDIKRLFLFEAAMIGLIGGIIGIALSYLASYFINKYGGPLFDALMKSQMNGGYFGETGVGQFSIIPIWLPFAAAGFAMLIGVLSGYFPAVRATKISAIEAMKSEG